MPAIKIGNEIIYEDQVCGVSYKRFEESDQSLTGYASVLTIFTVYPHKEVRLFNEDADQVWKWFASRAVDLGVLKPIKALPDSSDS